MIHSSVDCLLCSFPIILEPPAFTAQPKAQEALPGSQVVFKCAFTGSAPLTVKWFREEKEVLTGGRNLIKKESSSSSLEIYSVKPSDSAKYTCQVSNEAGKAHCTAVLFVKGAVFSFCRGENDQLLVFTLVLTYNC